MDISLYIEYLASKNKIDTKILSNFVTNASHTTPHYLKRLIDADLSRAINLPISRGEAKQRGSIV